LVLESCLEFVRYVGRWGEKLTKGDEPLMLIGNFELVIGSVAMCLGVYKGHTDSRE
jgi:hypothetical protein